MAYVHRRLVMSFFVVIFTIALIGLLYILFLNQALVVEKDSASFSVLGDKVVLKMVIDNNSHHKVDDIRVLVSNSSGEMVYYLKDANSEAGSFLLPGESYNFVKSWPLSDDLKYSVSISAPFNRSYLLAFEIGSQMLNPVEASVENLPPVLLVNKTYTYDIRFCNLSDSEIAGVDWFASAEQNWFMEQDPVTGDFLERTISLGSSHECKTFYYTLTPVKEGSQRLTFHLVVGNVEKKNYMDVNIV